jgi:hypothetical protein
MKKTKIQTKPANSIDVLTHRKNLISLNFTEEPVDIWTFLSNPHYLGSITKNGEGIFPVWRKALKEMFSDNTKTIIVLTGATGTGKSTIAIYALLYIQYRLMILRDLWSFFNINYTGKVSISFFNLNRTLGNSRGYAKMQAFMVKSPWFRKNALAITKNSIGEEELEFSLIKYLLSSPNSSGGGIIGEDIISGILDEVDAPNASKVAKEKMLDIYDATAIRFKGRFAKTGYSLGKLFVVSSKQDELAFIDAFIAQRKNLPEVLVFDVSVWDALPSNTFCGIRFPVAVGDAFKPSEIPFMESKCDHSCDNCPIKLEFPHFEVFRREHLEKGFKIVEVPIEYRSDFQMNIVKSLRDLGGVAVAGSSKFNLFSSGQFILDCMDSTKLDPVKVPRINIGLNDPEELIQYLNLDLIRIPKSEPRYIHLDISFSQDATGLAMSCISGWKEIDIPNPDGTFRKEMAPVLETDFAMRIKARKGDRIPIHKIRKLVLDLKASGFNIAKFTADLRLASEDTLQILKGAGINAEYFSVNTSMQPYFDFRNLVFERRWACHLHPYLYFELRHLEEVDGMIDHPDKLPMIEKIEDRGYVEEVMVGTKDLSDAVVGSCAQALLSKKKPMNTKMMVDILKSTSIPIKQEEKINISKLIGESEGKEITGVKEADGMKKIGSIMKDIYKRR